MPITRSRLSSRMPSTVRKFAHKLLWRRPSDDADASTTEFIRSSDVFDAAWYVQKYPDVARSGMDAASNYVK